MTTAKRLIHRRALLGSLAALAASGPGLRPAWSQQKPQGLPGGYPSKPVRVIVSSAPGGAIDLVSRLMMARLQERWGTAFVLDNRAGTTVALEAMARAPADGYTLLTAAPTIFFSAEQVIKVPYDVRTKFEPISQVISNAYVISVNNDLPVHSLPEFIAYAKANPTLLNYGVVSGGSASQLVGELLKMQAGIRMEAIGFKGVGPAYVEQMAGRIHLNVGTTTSSLPLVKTGKIRAIAVTSANRVPALPNVATVRETLPNFDVFDAWFGLFGVEGMPREIVLALNREMNLIMNLPDVKSTLTSDGGEITPGPPEQMRSTLIAGLESAKRVIKAANIRIE